MNRPLSLEEIEAVASSFKEDLIRECERFVRRGDNQGALSAIVGKEYIDKFTYALKMKAESRIGLPAEQEERSRPARARPIHIFRKEGA